MRGHFPAPETIPIPGWLPCRLEDGSLTATVTEVLVCEAGHVLDRSLTKTIWMTAGLCVYLLTLVLWFLL